MALGPSGSWSCLGVFRPCSAQTLPCGHHRVLQKPQGIAYQKLEQRSANPITPNPVTCFIFACFRVQFLFKTF